MCVPSPIIVHVTGEKLTENGPLLRAPSAFLGSFVSVLAVGLTGTLNTLILPLKSHIPQFAWRWQDHVGWNKLPTDPSSPDLSLACYSNQHHGHCAPPSRRKADPRAGSSKGRTICSCAEGSDGLEGRSAPYLLLTQPLFLLLFLCGLSLLGSKRQKELFFTPPIWLPFHSGSCPGFPAQLARSTMSVACVNLVFLPAVVLSKHHHCG